MSEQFISLNGGHILSSKFTEGLSTTFPDIDFSAYYEEIEQESHQPKSVNIPVDLLINVLRSDQYNDQQKGKLIHALEQELRTLISARDSSSDILEALTDETKRQKYERKIKIKTDEIDTFANAAIVLTEETPTVLRNNEEFLRLKKMLDSLRTRD